MKIEKMSLKSIKNVLSRAEMKKIMAGSSGGGCSCANECNSDDDCPGNSDCQGPQVTCPGGNGCTYKVCSGKQ